MDTAILAIFQDLANAERALRELSAELKLPKHIEAAEEAGKLLSTLDREHLQTFTSRVEAMTALMRDREKADVAVPV